MKTVREFLESKGREFPKKDEDGSISMEAYEAAGLPMVVACTNCRMTMALTDDRPCSDEGEVFCSAECAGEEEEYEG